MPSSTDMAGGVVVKCKAVANAIVVRIGDDKVNRRRWGMVSFVVARPLRC